MDPDYKTKYAIHEATREGQTSTVESLLNVSSNSLPRAHQDEIQLSITRPGVHYEERCMANDVPRSWIQANPKLAFLKDPDDRLPIHWAVAYNRLPIVELLVGIPKFNPDEVDASGWTPLMIAASLKDGEGDPIIELLLRKDADVNIKSVTGQNPLHFATSKVNVSTVRLLLTHKCSARVKDSRGQLALHRAAAVGSVPIINMLLQEGKSPLNATDADGSTALHHAIAEGNGEAALVLLRAGAEVDKRDNNDKLAIELAPDAKVRKYIFESAEREGIELS